MLVRAVLLLLVCCLQSAWTQTPQFVGGPYFQTVLEEQPVGSEIISVNAIAFDQFFSPTARGSFSIPTTGDAQYFSIEDTGFSGGANTAIVRNAIIFDWDTENAQRQYVFPVTFTPDSGASVETDIRISIADINDNAPMFIRDVFEIGVSEQTSGGSSILNVTANDPDQTLIEEVVIDRGNGVFDTELRFTVEHGRITYQIIAGNELGHFVINSENGTLSIAPSVQLDIDQLDFYNLTITATDGEGLSDVTEVLITVLDSNDNPPVILSPLGVNITIPEDTPPGYVVVEEINATDLDSGPNAQITFQITAGVQRERFNIDENSGRITISSSLDREVQSVLDLTVTATDQGLPEPLRDSIQVVVRLLDINDYTPTFERDSYKVSVSEGASVGSSVAPITAVDLDEGINGSITYSIIEGAVAEFYIDPSSGVIFTNASLDRETVSSYQFTVSAVDNPTNISYQLSSEVNVTILVEDTNDNAPEFEQDAYNISILDNVRRPDPIIQLVATDRDSGSNGMVTYRIEVPDPRYPLAWRIDENTGIIRRNRPLRFENQSMFELTIRALDSGPRRLADDVPLTITLHNVNENPPVFAEPEYNATILETTPPGVIVLRVNASDPDVGAIGDVRYRIVTDFDLAGSFAVNETSGEISVASSLDFDFSESVFFVVEAFDGGFPEPFTDRTNITVYLVGENDEAPLIVFPEEFVLVVPENTPPEVDVVQLSEFTFDPDNTDGDREDFATFSLVQIFDSESINASFSLNESTGLIRSLREFDREIQPEGIVLSIRISDSENVSRITNLNITIGDKNDNVPRFLSNESVTIHEFLPIGTEVLQNFTAVDDDIGSNADLTYVLFDPAAREAFEIDTVTGTLRTAAVLNRTVQDAYNLTVLVMDQGVPQMFGFGTIYVEVLDSNDMVPTFSESVYEASFSEEDPAGTFVIQVNASDADIGTNAEIRYFLAENDSYSDDFVLNSTTGELFTNAVFDHENISTIQLTVIAVDSGLVPHSLTGNATVLISVLDYNEFAPIFNQSSYEAMVIENAENGTFVLDVFATDEDGSPPNNLIRYSLEGERSDAFTIDPELGVIEVAGEVDWEEGAVFNITIVASDLATENRLNDTVQLMVTILDVNDRPPVFVPESLNLGFAENQAVGDGLDVGVVETTDADSPGNNSAVTYSVLMDFTNRKFTLDSETGLVRFVRGTLDRERRASYDLRIRATDHGSPMPLHTDANLTISVLDANDFDPVFEPRFYSASIPEFTEPGTPVIQLRATDRDIGSNAELQYSINGLVELNSFQVNASSGVIFVADVLDFETLSFYPLEVTVSDMGQPSRNDTATVEITVTDSNDFPPVFNQLEYSAVIRENLASGTTLLRVSATDADTDLENDLIEYSLVSSVGSANFGVDPETGVVYTNSILDREEFSFYNLTLVATNSRSPSPLSAEVQLLVTVTDLNDMHPTFDLVMEVGMFENATVGSILHVLSAEDGDEGLNGTVEYTLLQPSEYFQLNSTSGEIMLTRALDYESPQRSFMLPIMATDMGNESLSNSTNVLVRVRDSNDHAPRFASRDYSVTLDSESDPGTFVLRLEVSDRDEGANADVTLDIISGNDLGLFAVDNGGTISTLASLRSQPLGASFLLTIAASDSEHSTTANVTIYLQGGVQTSLPFFTATTFNRSLSESASDGTMVIDLAPLAENEIAYDIESKIFSVSTSGVVTLVNSSVLDFETFPHHQLTISVRNSAGDSAYAILNVQLTDENEHTPEFISELFLVSIPETLAIDELFFTTIAFDEDAAMPANVITYDIDQTDTPTRSRFRMDPSTGALSLTRSLEYEAGDIGFNLTVRATNSRATPPRSSSARVEIRVLNGNSFDPVFDQFLYSVRLVEDDPVGMSILNVSATDNDLGSHQDITYGLHGDHRYLDFKIDTFTGEIFTNAPLDYERKTFYTLELVAADGGNPGRTGTAALEVFIEDLNDNTPIWLQDIYTVSIIENATVGSSVIQTNASDVDQVDVTIVNDQMIFASRNGYVTYDISAGDPAGNFMIDPDTGLVTIASSLDRELYLEYNLTLNATDGGGLFSNAYLHIVVHDVNDKVPYFEQVPYSVEISEDADVGLSVLTVRANDTDLNRNSEITYHFLATLLEDSPSNETSTNDTIFLEDFLDPTGTFFLNDTTGEVLLVEVLDREIVPFYNLTVVAVDMGDTPLTGTTQILVTVLDINEFAPEFSQSGGFEGDVFENKPQGTFVLQVNATDMDFEENATVLYAIVSDGPDLFSIEAETGIVSVVGVIDYETIQEYEFIVMATDAGPVSERLVNFTNVTIFILDRNDNPPLFSESVYNVSIPEDSIPGDLVLNLNASDADSGSNAEITYVLDFLSGSEAETNFMIDPISGAITLSNLADLDTERTPGYDIIVMATDGGNSSMSSSALVSITVSDVNDNVPQFTLPYFEGAVFENSPAPTQVANVSAADEDTGVNAVVRYSIAMVRNADLSCLAETQTDILICLRSIDESSTANITDMSFSIDPESGEISTLYPLDREQVGVYLLEVVARDTGSPQQLQNSTSIVITVLDRNDELPTFTQSVYSANISEYSTSGLSVIMVLAQDMDIGSNAEVSYSLVESGSEFTVNTQSGVVLTAFSSFDRETRDSFNLTVVAVDEGVPSLTGSAVVVVEISDENDSPPIFDRANYTATVRENLPKETFVIQLNATDADIGLNAELVYDIVSSSPYSHFSVDPLTGVVSTSQALDRENASFYQLTVRATDAGSPNLDGTVLVEVVVMDHNDFAPSFENTPYRVTVDENFVPVTPVLSVSARDNDSGTNSDVFYTIMSITPLISDAFEIDQNTGDITLVSPLDAEVSQAYNITVRADNGAATPYQFSDTIVSVAVADLNDNVPTFEQLDYIVAYLESNPQGSEVITLRAFDSDVTNQNAALSYEITGGFNMSLFNITTTTDGVGMVSVAGILDRESEPRHVLEISVFDSGDPTLNRTTTLTVVLQDANDNFPIFEQSSYAFTLVENSPLFTPIGQITASDIDLQNVSYSLNSTLFAVDSTSGEIFTIAEFDREEQAFHTLVAVATDEGHTLERSAEVVVNVTVLDVNDVTPSFSNSTYFLFLSENTTVLSSVLTVEAFDSDFEINGTFFYSILSGNDSSFFSINESTGEIFLEQELDRETQDLLTFALVATDLGNPSLTGTADVVVQVLDNNDNTPLFNSTLYSAVLLEDRPVNTSILTVAVVDLDIEQNADVTFVLSDDFAGTFAIGEKTGVLTLVQSLDYERAQNYSFRVIVEDGGSPSLSNSSDVFIEVVDLNDNPPQFDSDVYQVSVPENAILGTEIFQIPATDSDSTSNGKLRYTILGGNFRSVFSVDEIFGRISVADYLDREITPYYSLELRVVDLGSPQFTATATLEVEILDVNDHIPMFNSKTYSVQVPESTETGTVIFLFQALDLDIDTNSNLTYSILAGNLERRFEIDPISGDLSVSQPLDTETYPSYALSVQVTDNGSPNPLADSATLRVLVLDENETPPTYPRSEYYLNISQNTVVGSAVGHFRAVDRDFASQGTLGYNLLEDSPDFEVDSSDGTLYVSRALRPGTHNLTLEASDGVFSTTIDIFITVLVSPMGSLASVVPLFDLPTYLFEISESAEVGAILGSVSPSGASLLASLDESLFRIDTGGNVLVTGELDREIAPVHVLNIRLPPEVTGREPVYAVLTVLVLDANDNPPMFESSEYRVVTSESLRLGSTLAVVQTFDVDHTPSNNSEITLSLSELGNERGFFDLDPSTGVLYVSAPLDYEANSFYVLTVVATNNIAMPTLSSSAQVSVSLIDENDNSPRFSEMFYQVSIPESTQIGINILNLEAFDADSSTNSELVFSITHLSEPLTFVIGQTTGAIATNSTFSVDMPTLHVISVSVADRGNPQPLAASTTIFVEVTPDNLSPPEFSDPDGYSVEIPETLDIGGSVFQVSATDMDNTVYSIQSGGSSDGIFDIDPSTGLVTLLTTLDFELQPFHTLLVQAEDDGTPPLSSIIQLNISVLDENNHAPLFDQRSYRVSVLENVTVGTSVAQVTATDSDAETITYQITVNYFVSEGGVASFAINSSTGVIEVTNSVDRELTDTIELLVSAVDSGYVLRRATSVSVFVDLIDLNDNPPVFSQPEYRPPLLRLLSSDKFVARIMASDADLVGEELVYSIVSDSGEGLFRIDRDSGVLETARRVPDVTEGYVVEVEVTDSVFVTTVTVNLVPVDDGDFCEANGFCTSVREVNCTFDIFPFIQCNPFCVLPYELSAGEAVCVDYSCLNDSSLLSSPSPAPLVPCVPTQSCLPLNMACNGTCPEGMSVCPTTDTCHMTSLSESCDGSNVTCLVGQSLVQRNDSSRYCALDDTLPDVARGCGAEEVYCEALSVCMNRSALYLCQACPGELVPCPNSNECVPDVVQCCAPDEEFCDVLNTCLPANSRCELPNIAPVVNTSLVLLDTFSSFEEDIYSSDGYLVSAFLNSSDSAFDSQGEELSVAIVGASEETSMQGLWQYALGTSDNWREIIPDQLSETSALVLPNTARVRFVRRALQLDGAVWLRVKLWDGNADGYLSSNQSLVRSVEPGLLSSTLPFAPTSAFSRETLLLAVLLHPLITPPTFTSSALQPFSAIQEDVSFSRNLGDSLVDLVLGVNVDDFQVLPDDTIQGFPDDCAYEQMLPPEVRVRYFGDLARVNPTRMERARARQSGQASGVAVTLDPALVSTSGSWQVALSNDPKQFLNLSPVLSAIQDSDILLLNVSARLRFLPASDFCGTVSIFLAPWDGFWNESVATRLTSGHVVSSLTNQSSDDTSGLSMYNVNAWWRAELQVECTVDVPQVLTRSTRLAPIPYRLAYRYERLFTVLVEREAGSLRQERELLTNYLQLVLQNTITLERFSPATEGRTYVSFSVDEDALDFGGVLSLINQRSDILALLNFNIVNVTQDASYGAGAGCPDSPAARHHHGDHVNTLVSGFASDGDNDFLGMAVVIATPTTLGVWQYHRGNWILREDASSQYNPDSNIWINFPPSISDQSAFLLHGNDRVRFLPHPHSYWDESATPTIYVKLWDNTLGGFSNLTSPPEEVSLVNINTDPLTDTLQSTRRPVGLFSTDVVTLAATRYGCDGQLSSGLVHDVCCVCGGSGDGCEGCDGRRASNVARDPCDVCAGPSSCLGCDLIPFSGTEPGPCDVCISQTSIPTASLSHAPNSTFSPASFTDCNGRCLGNALSDDCGICSGGDTSHDFNSNIDCTGMCFGNATLDSCGDCTGPGTGLTPEQNRDCTGVCGGAFRIDSCGVCQLPRPSSGLVTENRDCAGECFGSAELDGCGLCVGGSTGLETDSLLDSCGVCAGDNTTCIGCDGGVASGRSIDRCGECGGNDCGCFLLASISPNRGPTSGGTSVRLRGAGFFLNNTALLGGFNFNPSAPNCGVPTRFSNGSAVRSECRFTLGNEQLRVAGELIGQGTIVCSAQPAVTSGVFALEVSIHGGPFSNPVAFTYDDHTSIMLADMTPMEWGLNSAPTVTFVGEGFVNSSFSSCLVYDVQTCYDSSAPPPSLSITQGSDGEYASVPVVFVSSSEVRCVLPPADAPCRVRVWLSFDGQESGRVVGLDSADYAFTYRFSAPEVTDILFSDDLSSLLVSFDRGVDISEPLTEPSCANVFDEATFDLIGRSLATCFWSTTRQQGLTVALPASARVREGSPITFQNGILQTRRTPFSFSITNLTVVVSPGTIPPVAVIDGPRSIPFCGAVLFSGIHSQFPGYAGFEYYWSILVQDSNVGNYSEIARYINNLGTEVSAIMLNSDLFLEGVEYYVQLLVINSAGLESETESIQLLKDMQPRLHVEVLGSSDRSVQFGEQLVLSTSVSQPSCRPEGVLDYRWRLVRILDQRRSIILEEDIANIKPGLHQLTLPASSLLENAQYDLNLLVSSTSVPNSMARASVRIRVGSVTPKVRVHGGNRTVFTDSELVLDARNSTYSSQLTTPTFTWQCQVMDSLNACYNQSVNDTSIPTPISLPDTDYISFPSSILNTNSAYLFTLRLEQEGGVAMDTVLVRVVVPRPPVVEVGSPGQEFLSSQEVTIAGFVWSSTSLHGAEWTSVQQEGYGYVDLSSPTVTRSQVTYEPFDPAPSSSSLSPARATVEPEQVNRVNLVLSPGTLDPNLDYMFRLMATNDAGSSSAEVTIKVDAPPILATLTATPTSGVALETEFELTVIGALDIFPDSPFLYQFGIIKYTGASMSSVQWVSGIQASPSFRTILPAGDEERGFEVSMLVRVFDRKGGYSDVQSVLTVRPNADLSEGFYSDRLTQLRVSLVSSKDWSNVVSTLVAYLTEINSNSSLSSSQNLKEQVLAIFLNLFDTYLTPNSQHYLLASSVFSLLTAEQGIPDLRLQGEIARRLEDIASWFRNVTAIRPSLFSVPIQPSGQPLSLRSSYPVPEREPLSSSQDVVTLLSPWFNIVRTGTSDLQIAERFVMATEVLTNVLCQQSSTGEAASFIDTSFVDVFAVSAPPYGLVNLGGHLVNFGSSVLDIYRSVACGREGVACSETCITGITFPSDLSLQQQGSEVTPVLRLSPDTHQKVSNEIEGSSPAEIQLFSSIVSISLSVPSGDSYLSVQDLNTFIDVLIPVPRPLPDNSSIPLCLYREVGGASGYGNYEWLLDNTTTPSLLRLNEIDYYVCSFTHLSEFAIGLLPPPVITDPPPTAPPTPPLTTPPRPTTPTTRPTTPPPVVTEPVSTPVGAIAAVLIIVIIIVVVVVVIIIILVVWRKKKRTLKIAPDESTEEEKPTAELIRAGPLTPAESKVLMDIIQCLEEGKRTRLGKMNILPSIRLRELRYEITDHFPSLKNKPFYFLTRQLCDIDPTTEQQQFVSIVYGEKPIFMREVLTDNLQTKKHFCVCGNAAQFECSNCSSQGYCSEECQHSHWAEKHQKECSRLSERRRRSDVLYNRQNTSAPYALSLSPISEGPPGAPMGVASSSVAATATTPTNWKGFMSQRKTSTSGPSPQPVLFPPRARALSVPAKDVTTLGSLAKRLSVPSQTPGAGGAAPPISTTQPRPTLGPLRRLSFPQGEEQQQRPSVSRLSSTLGPPGPLSPLSPTSQGPSEPRSYLQSPLQTTPTHTFFTPRPHPQVSGAAKIPAPPARHLSITSVGSADFAISPQPISPIALEPHLESDEDDYESSSSGSGSDSEGEGPRASSGSRPPSLAVRRRDSNRVSSSSSSSSSSSAASSGSSSGGEHEP